MKVAVTGASGFIGRYVLDVLLLHDVKIFAITRDANSLKDYKPLIQIVELDITKPPTDIFDVIGRPDVLIHLAWDGLPNYKSLHHFETELPRQYQFLKVLIDSGLKSLLVSGTCFEYGMQSGALRESFVTLPNNPYGFAKDSLRKQLQFMKATRTFNLVWTRLFYIFGESQPQNSIYPQLEKAVERGDKLFNMSGGEQLRDYLPITIVAERIVRLALLNKDIGTVNLSSGRPISMKQLVEKWIEKNNWEIKLNLGVYPYPDYEPMEFWGDNYRLEKLLRQYENT